MTITDVKTDGGVQTYKLKGQIMNYFGAMTRDKFGRVTKVKNGGDKPS